MAKTVGGVAAKYLVDDRNPTRLLQVLEEIVNGSVQRVYTCGLSDQPEPVAPWRVDTELLFSSYDAQSNVRLLTNAAGAITDTYDYDMFGNLLASVGTTPNNYLYAGEQYDPACV